MIAVHHLIFTALFIGITSKTPPGFPPSLKPGCLAEDGQPNLFCPGDLGYGCYKIPTVLRTKNGTLLAMIEARKHSCDDQGYIDLRLRRSFDDGKTWGPSILVHGNSTEESWVTVGDANWVQDTKTGIIWLVHARNNRHLFLSSSKDEGETWSYPKNVTSLLKVGYPTQGWIGTGHAGGIQLQTGRLVIPVYSNTSYVIFSDDNGASWHIGGKMTGKYAWGGENQVAEMEDGSLIMSFRQSCQFPQSWGCGRLEAWSYDQGLTWVNGTEVKQLPEPIKGCDGSIVYHPVTKKLYFSHPDPKLKLFRNDLVVWSSSDHGKSWNHHKTVWPKAAGYSALVVMGDETNPKLGVLYDRNNHTMIVFEAQSVSFIIIDA